MKQIKLLAIILALVFAHNAYGATGCTYPTSLDTFTDKSAGDFLTVADVNEFRCGIEKIQAELGALPKGSYGTVVLRLDATVDKNGKAGGQVVKGGLGSGDDLTLQSTTDATKGSIIFGTASAYDEVNDRLGIGTLTPSHAVHVSKNAAVLVAAQSAGTSVNPAFQGIQSRNTVSSPTASQANDVLVSLQGTGYGATGFTGASGVLRFLASENMTDAAHGTYASISVTPSASTSLLSDFYTFHALGLRIGASAGVFAETALHLANINNVAAATFEESTATPSNPADGSQMRVYMKGDKFIIQYNDAATVRYKYLDLTGTGVTWVHTTTAP